MGCEDLNSQIARPELVIWGAGGHGRVVLDAARRLGYRTVRFIDDAARRRSQAYGCESGPFAEIARNAAADAEFIVAIGDNRTRAQCFARGLEFGWTAATLIHPSAVISSDSRIEAGTVVLPSAVINAGAWVGRNCIINTGAIVEHDCRISDHAHISPGAALGGNVAVESFAHLGIGASILPGRHIGEAAVVGAGAVVLTSVPARVTAAGVPARILPDQQKTVEPKGSSARILLSVPHMGGLEQDYIAEAFASNWLSTVGPNVTAFEREFSQKLSNSDAGNAGLSALAVSSGTAAIHLGLRALGVGPGDAVFCSDLTFVASVNPIRYLGATPVLIDSDRDTWNMDPELLSRALDCAAARNRLPKAVIVVHLFGQCADMDPIIAACARYDVPILEDAAEALGATYAGCPAGTLGEMAAFSFNGNKIITTTGGGMLVSRNAEALAKVRFWSTQARDAGIEYSHSELGYNYRLSNVLAGIGRGQLRVLDRRVNERREIAFRYFDAFTDLPGISHMPQAGFGLHTNWLSCFLIDQVRFGCSRDELIRFLDAAGIETRPVWKPMHLQRLYSDCECYGGTVAEDLFRRGICLPSSSSLSADQQLYVINQLRRAADARVLSELTETPLLA